MEKTEYLDNIPERPGRIRHIHIEGFRRLSFLEINPNPLMALIGANGVGKTSLLDALELLSASAVGGLGKKLSDFGGITQLLTRGKSETLAVGLEIDVPGDSPMSYLLRLAPRGIGYTIAEERLSQQYEGYERPFLHIEAKPGNVHYYDPVEGKLKHPEFDYNPEETALSQLSRMFPQSESFRQIVAEMKRYHALDVGDLAPVKLPQKIKPARYPGLDGEDLIPFLFSLREGNPPRFDVIMDTMRAAFPDLESLSFPPSAVSMLTMAWHDRNFPQPIYPHELSEGTLRFLWLIALLEGSRGSSITMIDEPETSLHPELLNLLSQVLREAARESQIIVATHSDRFVRFLNPEEIYVMDIGDDGLATVTPAASLDIKTWLEDYSLDELWQMGCLGGRA